MVGIAQVRRLALALPGAIEQDHHGRLSFRVGGKIFATLWTEDQLNVMLERDGILTVAQAEPKICKEFWWGERLGALRVDLNLAEEDLVAELLADAWERRASC